MSPFVLRSATTDNIYRISKNLNVLKVISKHYTDVDYPGTLGSLYSNLHPDWLTHRREASEQTYMHTL